MDRPAGFAALKIVITVRKAQRIIGLLLLLYLIPSGMASAGNVLDIEPLTEEAVAGPLDGMVFEGALGPDGQPKDIADSFVFANGTFVSKECELRCKYPARPYYVRVNGDKTEFISETQCPYKDAKIVWRGTVEGDRIWGKSTWMVRRWYWTVENTFEFEGKLVAGPASAAVID